MNKIFCQFYNLANFTEIMLRASTQQGLLF